MAGIVLPIMQGFGGPARHSAMKKILVTATFLASDGFRVLTAQQAPPLAVFTAAQAAAGKVEYQNDCHNCHTDKLTGRVGDPGELPAVTSLAEGAQKTILANGGKVPALAGPRFMARWGAKTTKDLSARIMEAAGLDEQRYLNITAYVLEFNGARPGAQALTKDTAVEVQSVVNQSSK
jgi:mono/diheme cytochrome c family protein